MRRGDEERGALLLLISERGRHVAALERVLHPDGVYRWERSGPPDSAGSLEISDFLARRARFDEDFWAIEVDIADAERFIAETTLAG